MPFDYYDPRIPRSSKKLGNRVTTRVDQSLNPFLGLRARLGMNMAEFSALTHISKQELRHLEKGNRIPTIHRAKLLQACYATQGVQVTLDDLFRHVVVTYRLSRADPPKDWAITETHSTESPNHELGQ